MPGCARKKLLLRDQVQVVHCYPRCVRREFLAGVDPLTGKDFSYRRDWTRDLLVQQAALFGIETGFHVQMSNHFHLVLRTRPDVVGRWSKEKVVRNWLKIANLNCGPCQSSRSFRAAASAPSEKGQVSPCFFLEVVQTGTFGVGRRV